MGARSSAPCGLRASMRGPGPRGGDDMKLRDVALCLVGGSIMYVSMAACAGRPSGQSSSGMTVHQGTGGSTPGTGGSGNTIPDSGIGDALTDPVGSANAEP